MDRETLLLLALGMLIASAFIVGVAGWILVGRDRRLARAAHTSADGVHPEAYEGL
jgi:hypothetical protein